MSIELSEQIGSESVTIANINYLDGEIEVIWQGIKGKLLRWIDGNGYSVLFDSDDLLNVLKGEKFEVDT